MEFPEAGEGQGRMGDILSWDRSTGAGTGAQEPGQEHRSWDRSWPCSLVGEVGSNEV